MSGSNRTFVLSLIFFAWLASLSTAQAHNRSQSFSTWRIDGGDVRVVFTVAAREVTRLPENERGSKDLSERLLAHMAPRLASSVAGETCPQRAAPQVLQTQPGFLGIEWHFSCPHITQLEIQNSGFFEVASGHINFAKVEIQDHEPIEVIFAFDNRSIALDLGAGEVKTPTATAAFTTYLVLGVKHILSGADHLAFLLALLLLVGRLRDIIFIVTGFTIGHSITLSLAVLGILEPNLGLVEALIGFTIALVALENVGVMTGTASKLGRVAAAILGLAAIGFGFGGFGPPWTLLFGLGLFTFCYLTLIEREGVPLRLRPLLTILFGLVHGFGFASVLMDIGLPPGKLALALFGFNLGVELGQIAVVAVIGLASFAALRFVPQTTHRLATDIVSASLFAIGTYWFIERAFSL
jgi:hypothetical protein